jgi:hypothetical protein
MEIGDFIRIENEQGTERLWIEKTSKTIATLTRCVLEHYTIRDRNGIEQDRSEWRNHDKYKRKAKEVPTILALYYENGWVRSP